jgi:phosphatidate phosphatase APP1
MAGRRHQAAAAPRSAIKQILIMPATRMPVQGINLWLQNHAARHDGGDYVELGPLYRAKV